MFQHNHPMNEHYDEWLARLQASIQQPALTPRLPLVWGEHVIGSVDAQGFAIFVAQAGLADVLSLQPNPAIGQAVWLICGDPGVVLQRVAHTMRAAAYAQVAHLWRDEQLAVCDACGQRVASVERGAVRALGIATHGVHLLGCTADNKVWVQQRALDKKTHPGRWDTLMGGMVSAADSLDVALARETAEEAGLAMHQLADVRWVGHFTMQTPNAPDNGLEYVAERIDWFEGLVPPGVMPVNTDGEVLQFMQLGPMELRQMLLQDAFTPEAAWILAQWLAR